MTTDMFPIQGTINVIQFLSGLISEKLAFRFQQRRRSFAHSLRWRNRPLGQYRYKYYAGAGDVGDEEKSQ